MTKEEKFNNALRDVFVGAKVEGESGYINLMRIKARYYEKGVFPKLQQDINEALKPFPTFHDELFEKLYDFFHRYFSESGSIYFRYTPLHQNVYEKVYTNDKDVMLFWKTRMLYYVKTDRLFKSIEVEVDGQKFFFDVSTLEHKKANEKRNIVYSFKEKRKDMLVFTVAYSEKGKKTKTDDILKALRQDGDKISEDILERAFRIFEKQSEVDYFINKDAKAFLNQSLSAITRRCHEVVKEDQVRERIVESTQTTIVGLRRRHRLGFLLSTKTGLRKTFGVEFAAPRLLNRRRTREDIANPILLSNSDVAKNIAGK